MTPILLYGFPQGSSLGLVAALEWLGRPYRLSRVAMPDAMQSAAYDRLNARRETPVLIRPDGSPLTETMAIAQWITDHDETNRVSFAAGSAYAYRMTQLMAFINTGFTGAFSPLWIALEDPELGETERGIVAELGRNMVKERQAQLEALIPGTPYLQGENPTLADALFLGVGRWFDFHDVGNATDYPKSLALRRRLEADPAAVYAKAIEDGETPTGTGACQGQVDLEEVIRLYG